MILFGFYTIANFEEMTMFFTINNIDEHEHLINVRQTRRKETISNPLILIDRLFMKNVRLVKYLLRNLIQLLRPHIVSKSLFSVNNLNTKVTE